MLDDEPRVAHVLLPAHALEVGLPALAVGRIGEHEIELARRKRVVGERRVLRAAHDVVGGLAAALQQQVGLADRVGLGVDLLPEEVGRHLLPVLGGKLLQGLLGQRQHASGAARPIVEQVSPRLDLVGDGEEQQPRHERHRVARGPVLAGLFVVLLVEPAHELLEHRAHAVVVESWMAYRAVGVHHRIGAQVDVRGGELLDERAQGVGPGEPGDLVSELEAIEDVLHVRGKSVEVRFEVGPQLLAARASSQVAQGELRRVVERLSRCCSQCFVLVDDARRVERSLHVQHRLLGVLQDGIEAPQHGHGEDDVAVLAAYVQVPQYVVADVPDVPCDPVDVPVRCSHVPRFPVPAFRLHHLAPLAPLYVSAPATPFAVERGIRC